MATHHPYQALLPNERGHDYFVGDIHGHFSRLQAALDARGFRPECDRLIAVGDLVDRGPECHQVLAWLERPWFHSIQGNHEELYLKWWRLREHPKAQLAFEQEFYHRNGGRWVHAISEPDHEPLVERIAALPFFLAVPTVSGRLLGVVHAELPHTIRWPECLMQSPSEAERTVMNWGRTHWHNWKHERGEEPWYPGLDVLVTGHTPVARPAVWGNHLFLDVGAWRKRRPFWILRADEALALVDGTLDEDAWPCPSNGLEPEMDELPDPNMY